MGFSALKAALPAMLVALAGVSGAFAQDQADNIPLENSDAIARHMFQQLVERQTGSSAEIPWAYEVDFNFDGFSELYGYVAAPNCDGVKCGLFLFVLDGDQYREAFGSVPGVRLTAPDKVFFGQFKRKGFVELQMDQVALAWDGKRYVEAASLSSSRLDGGEFLSVCQSQAAEDADAGATKTSCQCQLDRLQVANVQQGDLDTYVEYLKAEQSETIQAGPDYDTVAATLDIAEDAVTGCDANGGRQWDAAYFNHGEEEQQRLEFDAFIDACSSQAWLVDQRRVGTPDRALGMCGCIARELPTHGAVQSDMDALTAYYGNELADSDLDTQHPGLLDKHDAAAEACVSQFPAR